MIKKIFSRLHNITSVRYVIAGASVAVGEYTIAVTLRWLGLYFLYSTISAALIALCFQFLIQKFYTFRYFSKEKMHQEFLMFLGLWCSALLLKTGIVSVLTGFIFVPYVIAQFLAIATAATGSFLVYKYYIFVDNTTDNEIVDYNPENR